MKIGDIILNLYAGDKNPHRYGIFIRRSSVQSGKYSRSNTIVLLHSDGKISGYYFDLEHFPIVGHIDILGALSAFDRPISEALKSLTTAHNTGSTPAGVPASAHAPYVGCNFSPQRQRIIGGAKKKGHCGMKLYEFSALVSIGTVIAAESRDIAEERIRSFSAEGLVSGLGDVGEVSDIEFMEERELSGDGPFDEAHDAVAPQNTVEGGEKQRATQAVRQPEEPASAHA